MRTNIPYKLVRNIKDVVKKKPLKDGAIYFSTDDHTIYMDNGTNRQKYADGHIIEKVGIKKMASGNPIQLTDSVNYDVVNNGEEELLVQGSTTQNPIRHLTGSVITADKVAEGQTVPCKVKSDNVLTLPYDSPYGTTNGITAEAVGNGGVRFTGTATATYAFSFKAIESGWKTLPQRDYFHISGCPSGGKENTFHLDAMFGYDKPYSFPADYGNGATTTAEVDAINYLTFYIEPEAGEVDLTVYPMFNRGKTALPYAPFVDVAQSKVKALGRNFFDIRKINTTTDVVNNGDGTITVSNTGGRYGGILSDKAPLIQAGMKLNFNIDTDGQKFIYLTKSQKTIKDGASVTIEANDLESAIYLYAKSDGQSAIVRGIQFSFDGGEIEDYKEPTIYPVSADGTVLGVQSISPNMTLMSDTEGVTIDAIIPEPAVMGVASEVSNTGANLNIYPYRQTTQTVRGVTFTDNGDGSITVNGTNDGTDVSNFFMFMGKYMLPDTDYYISDKNGLPNGVQFVANPRSNSYPNGGVVHTSEDGYFGIFVLQVKQNVTINNFTCYPMLNLGKEKMPYEPPKGKTLKFSKPIELSKWDSIVKVDGLWKKKTYLKTYTCMSDDVVACIPEYGKNNCRINIEKLKATTEAEMYGNIATYVAHSYRNNDFGWRGLTGKPSNIWWFRDGFISLDVAKEYIKNNPLIIQIKSAEPIYEVLPEADQLMLNSLETFYPNTVMQTDEGVTLNVKYIVDTQKYINEKFTTITQELQDASKAVVALGGAV